MKLQKITEEEDSDEVQEISQFEGSKTNQKQKVSPLGSALNDLSGVSKTIQNKVKKLQTKRQRKQLQNGKTVLGKEEIKKRFQSQIEKKMQIKVIQQVTGTDFIIKKYPMKSKKRLQNVQKTAQEISITTIKQMKKAYKLDLKAFSAQKPAIHKLKYLETLTKRLRNLYVQQKFIQNKGLKELQLWLTKMVDQDDNSIIQPSITLKLGIFKALSQINFDYKYVEEIKAFQFVIQKNCKSVVPELKQLCQKIIRKWRVVIYEAIQRQKAVEAKK